MGGAVTHACCIYPGGCNSHLDGVGACGGEGSRARGGLGGTKLANSACEDIAGATSYPGRWRLYGWRRSRRPALPISSVGRLVYAGFSSSLFISIWNI